MKKSIVSLSLALVMVLATAFGTFAATGTNSAAGRIPTSITLKDLTRITEIANSVRGKSCKIVNAKQLGSTEWVVRLSFGDEGDQCAADFLISVLPYAYNEQIRKVTSLPFNPDDISTGTAIYGPCWYYFGVFDDVNHNICGFALAERIKRWPDWNDLTFNGVSYRGRGVTGRYNLPCSEAFAEQNLGTNLR